MPIWSMFSVLRITEGMRFELEHAREMKKPVRLYDRNFEQICVKTLPIDDQVPVMSIVP